MTLTFDEIRDLMTNEVVIVEDWRHRGRKDFVMSRGTSSAGDDDFFEFSKIGSEMIERIPAGTIAMGNFVVRRPSVKEVENEIDRLRTSLTVLEGFIP